MQNHSRETSPITNLYDQAIGLALSLAAFTLSLGAPLSHIQYAAESKNNPQRRFQKRLAVHPIITLPEAPLRKITE